MHKIYVVQGGKMSCKKPLLRCEYLGQYEINKKGQKVPKAIIVKPHDKADMSVEKYMKRKEFKSVTMIPCGKCIGCRLEYSRQWANRGYLESLAWEQNYFLTLTYNDENLPENGSLKAEHFTLFIKRLRQYMRKHKIQSYGIRFMGAGEYGEKLERPHYHIILFNCKLPVNSFYNARIINKNTYWQNSIIEKCWKYGFSNISDVTWNNIAYTARYITKKVNGKKSDEHYGKREKEFFRVSREPGIAGYYYEAYVEEIYTNDEIIVKNRKGASATKPPKYFDRLLEKDAPEWIEEVKAERRKRAKEADILKARTTGLTRLEQLEIEEATIQHRTMALIRQMERG